MLTGFLALYGNYCIPSCSFISTAHFQLRLQRFVRSLVPQPQRTQGRVVPPSRLNAHTNRYYPIGLWRASRCRTRVVICVLTRVHVGVHVRVCRWTWRCRHRGVCVGVAIRIACCATPCG
jgi:hypothetical protein